MKKEHQPEIIFSDEHIVVVNKPAGMLAIADRFDQNLPHLAGYLEALLGEIFVVHRLDKETSGVMVFGRTADAHKSLNDDFADRKVEKLYHAIFAGRLEQDEMSIDIPLMTDPSRKGLMTASARGKDSLTLIKVLERFKLATLAECDLRTGRQHQIRVHGASIGHPLLVDKDYGVTDKFMLSDIKRRYNKGKHHEERPIIDRLTLHARSIAFRHPASQEKITFEVDYPKDFRALLQVLSKYSSLKISPEQDWTKW